MNRTKNMLKVLVAAAAVAASSPWSFLFEFVIFLPFL
jgi:hypothetical protein